MDKFIGQRVRLARLENGMSQDVLGKELGISFQQVQKYEKGTNRVSASRLLDIAMLLKKSVSFFYGGDSAIRIPKADGEAARVQAFIATNDGMRLVKAAMPLPNALCAELTNLARGLGKAVQ